MTVPFTQYVSVKDNYCLAYFGEDEELIVKMICARDCIERELNGLVVFLACKDIFSDIVKNVNNVILQSKMNDYAGKMGCFCKLEEKQDLKSLLIESKIPIPEDF